MRFKRIGLYLISGCCNKTDDFEGAFKKDCKKFLIDESDRISDLLYEEAKSMDIYSVKTNVSFIIKKGIEFFPYGDQVKCKSYIHILADIINRNKE